MSVDSGFPDFRGSRGIWTTLLPTGTRKHDLDAFTQGRCFAASPLNAWLFYGQALAVCRGTAPHPGYRLLLDWARSKRHGGFVYTSNVDGQFPAAAGFAPARIVECHGSIHHFQCARPCSPHIWPAPHAGTPIRAARAAHSGRLAALRALRRTSAPKLPAVLGPRVGRGTHECAAPENGGLASTRRESGRD
ncbi:Sir2 family NAD-dependent protein deacetylase [Paraburkholderia sp. MM5477-R1]|uniref:Sir2 family NAD-dependent protein deacetylase n=1 Tax=Paraburkholderia sp. MM5477-R1 TaxID=2991062 RepID=UPI003D1F8241